MTTREISRRVGPAGPTDVIAFNIAQFVLGPVAGVLALFAALTPLPFPLRVGLIVAGVLAIEMTISAIAATWWVFGHRADRRWAWVHDRAGTPRRWINLTTGFDDSTATMQHSIPGSGVAVDVFDTTVQHDAALLRARRRFPPASRSVPVEMAVDTIESGSADVVFLLMAAHEAHGSARLALFRSAARALSAGGRLVLVEHLRDAANTLAFGPGAWHFSTRADWLAAALAAGLDLVEETRLTPFVAGFVFARAADR